MVKKAFLLYILVVLLILSSCSDFSLSSKIIGTWETEYVQTDNGVKETAIQCNQFKEDEEDATGGPMTETLLVEGVLNSSGYNVKYSYKATIKGHWDIVDGDLYLDYYTNTLQFQMNNNDVNVDYLNLNTAIETLNEVFSFQNPKADIVEELREGIYSELKSSFQDQHIRKETPYLDLNIVDGSMSFETEDMGTVTFKKIE